MARNNNDRSNSSRGSSERPMMGGWMDTAKDRPLATAAAAAAAVGAGVFLWSRRNQISDQLGHMSEQISEWSENMRSQRGSSSMESGSPSYGGGLSNSPMGSESGNQSQFTGAGTSSAESTTRATGGRRGKAQTGQTTSPSRSSNPTPAM